MNAYKPYQVLRKMDLAPQLPFDYLYSMLLGLVPPLWFVTMNPLLERAQAKKPPIALPTHLAVKAFFVAFNVMLSWLVLRKMFN